MVWLIPCPEEDCSDCNWLPGPRVIDTGGFLVIQLKVYARRKMSADEYDVSVGVERSL
jgi:hypothetical protein